MYISRVHKSSDNLLGRLDEGPDRSTQHLGLVAVVVALEESRPHVRGVIREKQVRMVGVVEDGRSQRIPLFLLQFSRRLPPQGRRRSQARAQFLHDGSLRLGASAEDGLAADRASDGGSEHRQPAVVVLQRSAHDAFEDDIT